LLPLAGAACLSTGLTCRRRWFARPRAKPGGNVIMDLTGAGFTDMSRRRLEEATDALREHGLEATAVDKRPHPGNDEGVERRAFRLPSFIWQDDCVVARVSRVVPLAFGITPSAPLVAPERAAHRNLWRAIG
jgi:hypothetical protein